MKYVFSYEPIGEWTVPAFIDARFRYGFQRSYSRRSDALAKMLNVLHDISAEHVCINCMFGKYYMKINITDASVQNGPYLGQAILQVCPKE